MKFPSILALTGAGLASLALAAAIAQTPPPATEPAPAQAVSVGTETGTTVSAAPEAAPAPLVALSDPTTPITPGDAAAGQSKGAVCAACHGLDGNSADPQYPKLAAQHERYIADQLALYKSGARPNPIMIGFASMLTPQDMRDVGAWFASQTVLPGVADETMIASGPNQGKKFYQVGEKLWRAGDSTRGIPACMACHGPSGSGNPGPAYPSLQGQHAGYVAARLTAYRTGDAYGDGPNAMVMADVAHDLTDEEIQALSTYVEGLHPANGAAQANATNPAAGGQ